MLFPKFIIETTDEYGDCLIWEDVLIIKIL